MEFNHKIGLLVFLMFLASCNSKMDDKNSPPPTPIAGSPIETPVQEKPENDRLTKEFMSLAKGKWKSSCQDSYEQTIEFESGELNDDSRIFFRFEDRASLGKSCEVVNRIIQTLENPGNLKVQRRLEEFKDGFVVEFFFSPIRMFDPYSSPNFRPFYTCGRYTSYEAPNCGCSNTSRIVWIVFKDGEMYTSVNGQFEGCPQTGVHMEPKSLELKYPYRKAN